MEDEIPLRETTIYSGHVKSMDAKIESVSA